MSIPFTQFLLPNGRRKEVSIERPSNIEDLALKVINAGGRFTCEVRNGIVSVACEYEDEDVAIELSSNGPKLLLAIDKMIKDAANIIL